MLLILLVAGSLFLPFIVAIAGIYVWRFCRAMLRPWPNERR